MKRILLLSCALISISLSIPEKTLASVKVPGGPSLGGTPVALPPVPAPMPISVVAPVASRKASVLPPEYSSVTVLVPASVPAYAPSSGAAFMSAPSYKDAIAKGSTPPALPPVPAPAFKHGDTPPALPPMPAPLKKEKSGVAVKDPKSDAKKRA